MRAETRNVEDLKRERKMLYDVYRTIDTDNQIFNSELVKIIDKYDKLIEELENKEE